MKFAAARASSANFKSRASSEAAERLRFLTTADTPYWHLPCRANSFAEAGFLLRNRNGQPPGTLVLAPVRSVLACMGMAAPVTPSGSWGRFSFEHAKARQREGAEGEAAMKKP